MSVALGVRRLAAAHWALLAVCAGFLLAGALVLDDFGLIGDSAIQRDIGKASLDYVLGDGGRALDRLDRTEVNRFYGTAFELPLVLVERVLGLEDSRDVWLSRHFLSHLFFLVGGVCCYLLVLRMSGSRLLAIFALALFLLHPRLYAHSFFNSKDVPFAAMFMIALYLTHRAFRRETLGAFLLCGVGVGVLVNLRAMGLILLVAVLALRALDLLFAGGKGERTRILLAGGAFASGAALTYYAVFPAIWPDPFGGFMNALQVASRHPEPVSNLFRGEWFFGPDGPPFDYIPVWIGITTPPLALLLAVAGVAALCRRAARRPRDLWRATPLRFHLLLVLLIVGTIVAVFAARSNIYNEWRHVYFLYAPLAVLAALGLHWLLSCARRRWMRAGIHALAGAGVAVVLVSLVRIHPLEDNYFNGFVDRTTPDYLATRYHIAPWWNQVLWTLMGEVIEDHPEQDLRFPLWAQHDLFKLVPESKRVWLSRDRTTLSTGLFHSDHPVSSREYVSRIYNNTIWTLKGRQVPLGEREAILQAALSGEPFARSRFDLYLHEDMVVFFREDCVLWEDARGLLSISAYPRDPAVLSAREKVFGYANMKTLLASPILDDEGRCSWVYLLPDYPVYRIDASQADANGERWGLRAGIGLPVDETVLAGEPLASGHFDVHRDGDALVYDKEGCVEADEKTEFLAYFFPVDPGDLPDEVGRDGFDGRPALRRSFRLWNRGARTGERCVTPVPLPDWPVANVLTGQFDESGWRWRMRFAVTPPVVDEAVLAGEPLASGDFAIHRDGDALVYVRDGCTEEEAEARFLFHVYPVDPRDLPAESQSHGFENRDFGLWDHGARVDGRCLAIVPLPDYPVDVVRTGQYDEAGDRWVLEFSTVRADAMRASLSGEPVASSVFDVYREDGALVYVRDGCTEEDAGAGFFLHVIPVDVDDLPAARREHGFDNRDFTFATRGARVDGRCVAAVPLPGYPIASIRTGQYDETGERWSVEFTLPDGE